MKTIYCSDCRERTEHRRTFSGRALLGAVFTFGISLLAFPLYSECCAVCGKENLDPTKMNTDRLNAENFIPPKWQKTWWGALAFVVVAGLVAYLLAVLFFGTG